MNYAFAALTVACLGIAGLMTAGSHMEPRPTHCSEAKKGSIVAVMNCPELAEDGLSPHAAVGKRERDSALARARGQQ